MFNNIVDSPQYVLDHLDPSRITFARERLGLTRKDIAEKIRRTPSAISQFESGLLKPDLKTLIEISNILQVPASFFVASQHRRSLIDLGNCHFRAKRAASQKERRRSVRLGEQLLELIGLLESQGVSFPTERVSPFARTAHSVEDIELIASQLRKDWGMGFGPLPNVIHLLESKGIVVLPIYDSCREVDAFSVWSKTHPCVMLSLHKSASRARFDAAHELGHLIMHEEAPPGDSIAERQADRFAGAFLAPRESFLAECPRKWHLPAFQHLKVRWKMSIQALVRRAYDLGQLSYASYSRAFQDISRNGMRQNEGEEWPIEQPSLISQAFELLKDNITLPELAEVLGIHQSELSELLGPCVSRDLLLSLSRTKLNEDKYVTFKASHSGPQTLHGS